MRMKDTPAATPGQYANNGITNTTSIVLILYIVFPKPCITWVMWRDNGTKNYRTLTEKPWLNAGNAQSLMVVIT